jgi:hypothetical protein
VVCTPTLQELILKLLEGVYDPRLRADVTASIMVMAEAYAVGAGTLEAITRDINAVVLDVLRFKNPLAPEETLREEAKRITDEIVAAIKVYTALRRTLAASRRGAATTTTTTSPFPF